MSRRDPRAFVATLLVMLLAALLGLSGAGVAAARTDHVTALR